MTEVSDVLNNVFDVPEFLPAKKERMAPESYRKRYQLLEYDDVTKLSDVMETTVPIDGKGNFPSLEVKPSTLVQMVRDALSKEGIRVPNVRLNGSAATHVLSGDGKHPYKDLDLIFVLDLSEYNEGCTCADLNNNINNNTYCKTKGQRNASGKRHSASKIGVNSTSRVQSPTHDARVDLPVDETIEGDKDTSGSNQSTPGTVSPTTVLDKAAGEEDDAEDKDSGYTSSGSSVSSLPVSPAGSWVFQNPIRSRTHSLDSASSVTSSSSLQQSIKHRDGHYLDIQARNQRRSYTKEHQEFCSRPKESCWHAIKGVVMKILRDLLPDGVSSSRMTDAMLTDAYVQKMVKITNDVDRWSLISLNNDAGRNLELKFVENMRRQYEFSVDSFQIILDSYQRFKIVSRKLENSTDIHLSPNFFPSVLAESVYGDFHAALRHLRHRRICTKRPEEIRGGGLLRYCNLKVRDFTPGEVEGYKDDVIAGFLEVEDEMTSSTSEEIQPSSKEQSYSTSHADDVKRLEQLMCSRFFIDFNEFTRQKQKLLSYLDSHFQCEEDLKFQYLLIVGKVVERGTVCLMSNERSQIVDFIKKMALDTLARDVKSNTNSGQIKPQSCVPQSSTQSTFQYPPSNPLWNQSNNNNCCYSYPQYMPQGTYAPGNYYPQYPNYAPDPNYYPQCDGYCMPQQVASVSLCPCCRSTYSHPSYCAESAPVAPQVIVTPPQHTMSVNSPPFYPRNSSKSGNDITKPVVYLNGNAKLIYSTGPPPVNSGLNRSEPSETETASQ